MLAGDVNKIEDAFRRQTGIIEERTGTMERALSAGVDNIRNALERSAGVVAGALREKVLEVTSALTSEAGNAFTEADRKIAERAEQTSATLMQRAGDIARTFDDADRRARRPGRGNRPLARHAGNRDRICARAPRRRHPAQLRRCRQAPEQPHRRICRGARRACGRAVADIRRRGRPPHQPHRRERRHARLARQRDRAQFRGGRRPPHGACQRDGGDAWRPRRRDRPHLRRRRQSARSARQRNRGGHCRACRRARTRLRRSG